MPTIKFMKKIITLISFFILALFLFYAKDVFAVSCTKVGYNTICDDGVTYTQVGNNLYGSNGTSCVVVGNNIDCNGTTYTKVGNTTYGYGDDATTYTQVGNNTYGYGDNGGTYTKVGNTTSGPGDAVSIGNCPANSYYDSLSSNCKCNLGYVASGSSCIYQPSSYSNPCTPNWQCSGFGICTNYLQTQTCSDLNNCNTTSGEPSLTQSCTVTTPTSTPILTPAVTQQSTNQTIAPASIGQITSVSPQTLIPGGQMTITGSGFGDGTGWPSNVCFGSHTGCDFSSARGGSNIQSWSDSQIILTVPYSIAGGGGQITVNVPNPNDLGGYYAISGPNAYITLTPTPAQTTTTSATPTAVTQTPAITQPSVVTQQPVVAQQPTNQISNPPPPVVKNVVTETSVQPTTVIKNTQNQQPTAKTAQTQNQQQPRPQAEPNTSNNIFLNAWNFIRNLF
jgi:hypothetical protein